MRHSASDFARVIGLAIVFGVLAYLSISLTRDQHGIAALWLPNAMLVAVMLRSGRFEPVQIAAAFGANIIANLAAGDPLVRAIALSLANGLEISLVCFFMRRRGIGRPDILRFDHLISFIAIGGIVAPLASGAVAAATLANDANSILDLWLTWALTDALGMVIVAPTLWIVMDSWQNRGQPSRRYALEWLAIMCGGFALVAGLFVQSRFPLLFVATPFVLLAAFRLGGLGAAAATMIVAVIASIGTTSGTGPIALVDGTLSDKLHVLQAFLAANFAMSLPVAAVLESRAAAVQALADAEVRNRSILDNMREIVFQTDAEGRWTFLNPAWEQLTGYSVVESLGWQTTRLLHPDDRDTAQAVYPDLVSGTISEATLQQRFFRRDGECRHIEVSVRRLSDHSGRFQGTSGNIRDVTDIVVQRHALEESEARFRRMAEAAPVGIFRADADGQVTYVNAAWCAKIGLTLEQSLGNGWMAALADVTPYMADPPWQGMEKPGDIKRRVARFRGADGQDLWVETVNSAEFDEQGRIAGYLGVVIDITEQMRSAERLAYSERRFEALANLAPAGIFRTDANGLATYVNPAWRRMTGMDDDRWMGDGWRRALHPDDRARVIAEWMVAVDKKSEFRSEHRWLLPDGTIVWVDALGQPELAPDGSVAGFIGVNLDISARHAAMQALAEREAELSLLANNATDAILRLSLSGECLYASPSARELFELPPEALIGQNLITDFHPDDDAQVRAVFATLGAGNAERALVAFRSASPSDPERYRWMEANCALLRDRETGVPQEIIASIRNISATKELEKELRLERERAEQAAIAKSAFLANMSHEIRTPMNGVIGFTELLQAGKLSAEQRRQIDMIAESGRAMMRLLNDILDISKIEAGQMQIALEPTDPRHLIRGVIRLMEPAAQAEGLALEYSVTDDVPEQLNCDPLRLRQILLNLVGNALKFTEHGGVRARLAVEITPTEPMLRIEVEDSGIGIAADRLESIFETFTQADPSVARRFGGTGLGLAITRHLVELMRGTIEVSSHPGTGSCFTVRLPMPLAATAVPDKIEPKLREADPPLSPVTVAPRILVAEDNEINQELIRAMAAQLGQAVDVVPDGMAAIAAVESRHREGKPYGLVLMDIQMPDMDGLEATRQLRARGHDATTLPIVALTANAYADDVAASRAAGMQHHIAKPVTLGALAEAIERFAALASRADPTHPAEIKDVPDTLRRQYVERRSEVLNRSDEMVSMRVASEVEWDVYRDMLHRLSGTAAYFGDAKLGSWAAELEFKLREADSSNGRAIVGAALRKMRAAKPSEPSDSQPNLLEP